MYEKERLAIELGTIIYVNTIESLQAENAQLKEELAEFENQKKLDSKVRLGWQITRHRQLTPTSPKPVSINSI